MLTFKDVKDSSIANVAGYCTDSQEFAFLVNDACRRLLRRGDWVGTVQPIHMCAKRGCLVMPRYVQSIRKINVCNVPLTMGNLWYNFINNRDLCHPRWGWHSACDAGGLLTAQGQTSTYQDIMADGRVIRAYITAIEDVGKVIRFFGVDNGNQPLRCDNLNGTWSDGAPLALGWPYTTLSLPYNPNSYVRRIDRVTKDVTQGQVLVYAYDAVNNMLEDIAIYDPGETTPTYARYQLNVGRIGCSNTLSLTACCNTTVSSIVALVKLRFIPAKFDTDLVIVDNLDALKDMVQSVKLREAGDPDASFKMEASAVRELQRDLEDNYPDDTFSAQNYPVGTGVSFSNQCF